MRMAPGGSGEQERGGGEGRGGNKKSNFRWPSEELGLCKPARNPASMKPLASLTTPCSSRASASIRPILHPPLLSTSLDEPRCLPRTPARVRRSLRSSSLIRRQHRGRGSSAPPPLLSLLICTHPLDLATPAPDGLGHALPSACWRCPCRGLLRSRGGTPTLPFPMPASTVSTRPPHAAPPSFYRPNHASPGPAGLSNVARHPWSCLDSLFVSSRSHRSWVIESSPRVSSHTLTFRRPSFVPRDRLHIHSPQV